MKDVRVKVIFIELICTDQELVKSNILRKVAVSGVEVRRGVAALLICGFRL
jgi:hypothetical protein